MKRKREITAGSKRKGCCKANGNPATIPDPGIPVNKAWNRGHIGQSAVISPVSSSTDLLSETDVDHESGLPSNTKVGYESPCLATIMHHVLDDDLLSMK